MGLVKIRMNTWQRCGNRETKFKRGVAPREGFVEYCTETKKVSLKAGDSKWKPWDTALSRKEDKSYIEERKKLYSGLCFNSKQEAQEFMKEHEAELNEIAAANPLFNNWSIMNVIKRFEPQHKKMYKKNENTKY